MSSVTTTARLVPTQPVRVHLTETFGWRRYAAANATLWFKGHLFNSDPRQLLDSVAAVRTVGDAAQVAAALDGHFAFVATAADTTVAAVDRIGSVPLSFAADGDGFVIDGDASRLAATLKLTKADPDALLAIGMAGYTIGPKCLWQGLNFLAMGEVALFGPDRQAQRRTYYTYDPWQAGATENAVRSSRAYLEELTLTILNKMIRSLDGRPVLLPLSAGLDSRLIASGLRHLGYDNVRCFSYGRAGNFEARGAQAIAERLGYRWTFVPHTPQELHAHFNSATAQRFIRFADTLAAIPFHQDLYSVARLKESGYAPSDAVFVNGQSGDFLTGNHVPDMLCTPAAGGISADARWNRVIDALIAKHFSLWRSLLTPVNRARIAELLRADLESIGAELKSPEQDYGLYEASECRNRQSKYVIAGQRAYEFLGFDWRLPLWDRDYLDFWVAAPLHTKRKQHLYREMLNSANWGGVWGAGWSFPRSVRPRWLSAVRLGLRAVHWPLGQERWHAFERQYLAWPMDLVCNYAVVPYRLVMQDARGHRNAISWHVERYFLDKGLSLDSLSA